MKRPDGFTLIELMVVMGIMVLVTTIVVSGSFGMSRASGYTAAENVVYNTLQVARQRACTDGRRVIVAFISEEDENKYRDNALTAVEAAGTVTEKVSGAYIQDRCANLAKYMEGGRQSSGSSDATVWNLRNGKFTRGFQLSIQEVGAQTIPGGGGKYQYSVSQISVPGAQSFWKIGDPYGFQIVPIQVLPRGFKIGDGGVGQSPKDLLLVFEPDGSGFCGKAGSGTEGGIQRRGDAAELLLYEEISGEAAASRAVRVKFERGAISVVKPH